MPKVGHEDERKSSIIEATIAAIHECGYGKVTMAQIARNAGVSAGLPHHYFGSKAGLFNATITHLLLELSRQVNEALQNVEGPLQRVLTLVETNFSDEQFQPGVISAWLAFYAEARNEPQTNRLLRIYQRRLVLKLRAEFRQLLAEEDARRAAEGTAAMIDGLWLQRALVGGGLVGSSAAALVADYVQMSLKSARSRV
ncbi:transcriptional regulator BetI [Polycladidibacter hongkongensis]|uniref:transcriptional regulator BetI n=1 Tax=Polycladidibacter hongkongensis TaxID=1647556 RepID=UPI000833B243|nr:transcriptional regulator BetI [Pseudovibrio hongkongensis]